MYIVNLIVLIFDLFSDLLTIIKGGLNFEKEKNKMVNLAALFMRDNPDYCNAFDEDAIGKIYAAKDFDSVTGLTFREPLPFFDRIFNKAKPSKMLIATKSLIFINVSSSIPLDMACIPFREIVSVDSGSVDGSMLIIKFKKNTISCETNRSLGANISKKIIKELIFSDRKIS
jgi:hypothetical protein